MCFSVSSIANRVANSGSAFTTRCVLSGRVVTRTFSTNTEFSIIEYAVIDRLKFCNKNCFNEKDRTYGKCSLGAVNWLNSQGITIVCSSPDDPADVTRVLEITQEQVHKMPCPFLNKTES